MRRSELIKLLSLSDEEEVYIEIDNTLYDIETGHVDEVFDGFDTVYPACLTLKAKEDERTYQQTR